ncbi:integrase [Cellulophaga phage Ingeline_1]|uniref:Integrase n=1 Tax=Cellulophaga phage Ingeline_1 TaxID=2745674 RepID=A0A8E4ZE48_9CAUD|nr:integrase [Cellulophaga phage Ingeline_1]QQV90029.1 integrase [Cellulophaga phage Ingeline_2]QQV90079.1 integrase [Cellulophaga phage Ingeline_3]QQV90129.1 integrase [Cellulophaga phage Ingeline_4]QQV90177.1 integrase [Cellulophaga phage Ingeline_5]QQV90228.1 integrase [Cellulophaga phage Ingeline_6]QQV90278.1 integrase [Cellulophaga phage Ingeline_7]QQV90304.1 integrase [Cellulophaga phage Ingeline_8]
MDLQQNYYDYVPQIDPQIMSGKLTYKIVIKKDHIRTDGTSAIYLQLFQNGKRKRLPLHISVPVKDFDTKKQLVKKSNKYSENYNLLIGKMLGDLNKILVFYKLSGQFPILETVISDLTNPSLKQNYNTYANYMLEQHKNEIKESTYKQQKGALNKIKEFQDPILFSEITEDFEKKLRSHCRKVLKNKEATIESTMKNFKKYLHFANKNGINTPLLFSDISVKKMIGQRLFLMPEELKLMYDYCNSPFINNTHHKILKRYLFSCFTGIRLSDSETIKNENFIGGYLAFTMVKTNKFIRIKLNKTALSLIELPDVFDDNFSRKHINEELKVIAATLGINKRLYFHSSRHTFATNFLISGGNVVNLKKLLGHSNIDETMNYVHIVESITDTQIEYLDSIVI